MSSTLDAKGNIPGWFGTVIFESAEAAGIKLTEARVRIYAADLGDLEPQQIIDAFRRCRKEGSGFFPSIVELRKQVVATPDDRALMAWTSMEQAARRVGAYQSIEFEDPVAALALVQVFGSWPQWCEQETGPELLVKRQQFLAAYREVRRQQAASPEPVRLAGLLEATGKYERHPALAVGKVTESGDVLNAFEVARARLEGGTTRQLPQGEDSTNG